MTAAQYLIYAARAGVPSRLIRQATAVCLRALLPYVESRYLPVCRQAVNVVGRSGQAVNVAWRSGTGSEFDLALSAGCLYYDSFGRKTINRSFAVMTKGAATTTGDADQNFLYAIAVELAEKAVKVEKLRLDLSALVRTVIKCEDYPELTAVLL